MKLKEEITMSDKMNKLREKAAENILDKEQLEQVAGGRRRGGRTVDDVLRQLMKRGGAKIIKKYGRKYLRGLGVKNLDGLLRKVARGQVPGLGKIPGIGGILKGLF